MKKLLLLGAALFAAVAINAASFVGFDGRDGTLGQQIYDGLIQNQDNITLNETDATAHKYEIKITTGGECSFTMGGVKFWYKNSNDGTIAFKSFGTYIQPNGNKRSVTIPTVAGEKVRIFVQDEVTIAVEGVAEGASVTLKAWGADKAEYTELTATGSAIVLWSDDRDESTNYAAAKFKLGAVLPADASGLVNLEGENAVKDGKFMQNGQIYIRKNGKVFNILGAQVAE